MPSSRIRHSGPKSASQFPKSNSMDSCRARTKLINCIKMSRGDFFSVTAGDPYRSRQISLKNPTALISSHALIHTIRRSGVQSCIIQTSALFALACVSNVAVSTSCSDVKSPRKLFQIPRGILYCQETWQSCGLVRNLYDVCSREIRPGDGGGGCRE